MLYTLENEFELTQDEIIRIHKYWDRKEKVMKIFDNTLEIKPGDNLILSHVSPETAFEYIGKIDRDSKPHLHFTTNSDYPVSEIIISPEKFQVAMGDDIWFA